MVIKVFFSGVIRTYNGFRFFFFFVLINRREYRKNGVRAESIVNRIKYRSEFYAGVIIYYLVRAFRTVATSSGVFRILSWWGRGDTNLFGSHEISQHFKTIITHWKKYLAEMSFAKTKLNSDYNLRNKFNIWDLKLVFFSLLYYLRIDTRWVISKLYTFTSGSRNPISCFRISSSYFCLVLYAEV